MTIFSDPSIPKLVVRPYWLMQKTSFILTLESQYWLTQSLLFLTLAGEAVMLDACTVFKLKYERLTELTHERLMKLTNKRRTKLTHEYLEKD